MTRGFEGCYCKQSGIGDDASAIEGDLNLLCADGEEGSSAAGMVGKP
jgi:hypothetical protein